MAPLLLASAARASTRGLRVLRKRHQSSAGRLAQLSRVSRVCSFTTEANGAFAILNELQKDTQWSTMASTPVTRGWTAHVTGFCERGESRLDRLISELKALWNYDGKRADQMEIPSQWTGAVATWVANRFEKFATDTLGETGTGSEVGPTCGCEFPS